MNHPISSISERKIRIALVGCGRISRNHIRATAIHCDRSELVAICDTEQERLDAAQQLVTEVAKEYPSVVQCLSSSLGMKAFLQLQ